MMTGTRRPSDRAGGRRLLALAAAGLAMMFMLAGCAQDAGPGIATASGNQGAAPASANPAPAAVDPVDAALAYARCIRANGYPDWPDPDGEGQFMITRGSGGGFNDPRRVAAMEACQDLRPAGTGMSAGVGGLGAQGGADEETRLVFAQCMRENGVPDFPDPSPSAGGRVIIGSGAGIDANDPRFQAAMRTCAPVLAGEAR
jgi:hypothetical protein